MNNKDFSRVREDVNFLPTDLGMMLGFLYRKSIRYKLNTNIKADAILNTKSMSKKEVVRMLEQDINNFGFAEMRPESPRAYMSRTGQGMLPASD